MKTSNNVLQKAPTVGNTTYVPTSNDCIHHLLPNEVMLDIFKFLKIPDIAKCRLVCKDWNILARDEFLWNFFMKRDLSPKLGSASKIRSPYEHYQKSIKTQQATRSHFQKDVCREIQLVRTRALRNERIANTLATITPFALAILLMTLIAVLIKQAAAAN